MSATLPEFRDAPLKLTSLRAPEGLFDRAREELGYSSNQEMVISLVELALKQRLQRQMVQRIASNPDGPYAALADPAFLREARR